MQKRCKLIGNPANRDPIHNAVPPLENANRKLLAVGGIEPDLFHWQSLEYAARLRLHGVRAEYVSMAGDNHFSITDRLGNARDPLTKALIAQMGL